MTLYLWNLHDHFQKKPPIKHITSLGKRNWDPEIEYNPQTATAIQDSMIFTMPCFGRHGRWGNMVFQYLFIRILALNNKGKVELYRGDDRINSKMNLYDDMRTISTVKTTFTTHLIDSYHIFPGQLNYIPGYMWRAMYISNVHLHKCYFLENAAAAINQPLPLPGVTSLHVEGLFIVNPSLYKQHKKFILSELFKPAKAFSDLIDDCMKGLGSDKTIIGIHIRKGDFVYKPLNQLFQFPIPGKYIINWLVANISLWKNPVLVVCSDDPDAYKEIKVVGIEVFSIKQLLPETEMEFDNEQLDWEILRRCNVLLTSNSSFSFSAAFLSLKEPACYQFSLTKKEFIAFNPWESEPLQFHGSPHNFVSYVWSRFIFVYNMVNGKFACFRIYNDVKNWLFWKISKVQCLYLLYGISFKLVYKLFNFVELFQLNNKNSSYTDYKQLYKIKL